MNGYETARPLKRLWPEVKTLAYCLSNNSAVEEEMRASRADGYIEKVSDLKDVIMAIPTLCT